MGQFCLPEKHVTAFKKALKDREIDPADLIDKTSDERREIFSKYVGEENAKDVNSLFESKMLLKNVQQGMITWAKTVAGMKPRTRQDMISRIERLDERILNPVDETAFLRDLAAQKLGIGVTMDEVKALSDLVAETKKTKAAMDEGADRLEYGRAQVALNKYVGELKLAASRTTLTDIRNNPIKSVGKLISGIAGNAKAINASMDDSAIFRQGWKTLWTNPMIWQRNARKSFVHLVKMFGQEEVMDNLNADIVSRPTFDLMRRAKLDVGVNEEQFPTHLPEKIPVLGRVYKATENAYTAFVRKTRADVFDKYIDIANKAGVNLDDRGLQSIGKMVNSLTGRGHLGPIEPVANVVNNVFFSPRMLKSHIDFLLSHPLGGAGGSNFVRKQAALNLLKVITGTAAVLAIARALKKDSVELDPRSADFGKIRIGDTRFDVTGGMSSLATLAARLATQSSKSSTTGKVTELNSGKYGAQTTGDVLFDFFANKLAPAGQVVKDIATQKTFAGPPPTVGSELKTLFSPLPVKTFQELNNNPNAANIVVGMIADALGISVNTYGKQVMTDQNISPAAKEAQQKQMKVGDELDAIERMDAMDQDTTELRAALKEKIEKKMGRNALTDAEAERANKILGLSGKDAYEGQVEDAPEPTFPRRNRNADTIIEKVSTWAKAIGADPVDAFDKLFKGEHIARLENGAIIVLRQDKWDPGFSDRERKRLGGGGKAVKLDHTVPLELAGTNQPDNLRLVTTEEHASYTPIENYLGDALHNGKINVTEAQDLIRGFKNGIVTKQQVIDKVGEPFTGATTAPAEPRKVIGTPGVKTPRKMTLRMPSLRMPHL